MRDYIRSFIHEHLAELKQGIVVIVGAGASVASGLQTFRGEGGYWQQYRAEDLASRKGFNSDPKLVWEWYAMRIAKVFEAKPNNVHYALVDLEKLGLVNLIVTQNVDGLHRLAGSNTDNLIEIHGTITKSHCINECGHTMIWEKVPEKLPVKCVCGALQRPSVVWFGEMLNPKDLNRVDIELKKCGTVITIGTSGIVYPVASYPFIAAQQGKLLIDFNIKPSEISQIANLFLEGGAEDYLPLFVKLLKEELN